MTGFDRGGRRGALVALFLSICAWSPFTQAAGPRVAIDTTVGRIVVEVDPERAPVTSRNFLRYVAEGHYDGTVFHRVMAGFMIQGGGLAPDLREKATHAPIVNEARNGLSNVAGSIAMAREDAVDSATSQFFINVVDNARLDHVDVPPEGATITRRGKDVFVAQAESDRVFGYAVFGRVVDGMDVVERIRHVAVGTAEKNGEVFENVPIEPIIIQKAALLPPNP
jgi:cyclophilin family peptidyl-prolyl cis-trans isomerase